MIAKAFSRQRIDMFGRMPVKAVIGPSQLLTLASICQRKTLSHLLLTLPFSFHLLVGYFDFTISQSSPLPHGLQDRRRYRPRDPLKLPPNSIREQFGPNFIPSSRSG